MSQYPSIPERYLEPPQPTVESLPVGADGLVFTANIYLDEQHTAWVKRKGEIARGDRSDNWFLIRRDPDGLVLRLRATQRFVQKPGTLSQGILEQCDPIVRIEES